MIKMELKTRTYFLNSFLLVIIETVISTLVFMYLNDNFKFDNDYSVFETAYRFIFGFFALGLLVFLTKIFIDFFPKILIQFFLVNKYRKKINFFIFWFPMTFLGVLISFFWWFESGFVLRINFDTAVALSYIPAVVLSPFILNKFGWNCIDKLNYLLNE